MKQVAIIHYNTPERTEAAILSLRKHGGERYRVVVFDNSDARPFRIGMKGVEIVDNTKGQIINFDKILEQFPERDRTIGCSKGCEFGSVKHMMTVQKLWDLLPDGFVLMESDVLIKKNIDEFFCEAYSVYGYWQKAQPFNPFNIGRMLPMLCWMNVPMLKREGARYFDPTRTYGLLPGGRKNRNNWYDTGAVLLEDILNKRPRLKGFHRDIRDFLVHYGSGSWANNNMKAQAAWLNDHRDLWEMPEEPKTVAVCAIGRYENRYAVEWVEHYKAIGVDKIYIYDNNRPEDGEVFADVLQPYIDSGLVGIVKWDGLQKQAYEDCYNRHNGEHRWMGFFDFDEFVEIQDGRNVKDLLACFDFADVLVMNWRTMTDSGQLRYKNKPVKERFTEATGEDFPINAHVKCFVQTGINGISFNDPHCPNAPQLKVVNAHGITVEQVPIQPQVIHDVARVDHFNTKSTEEYIDVKWKRGTCCGDAWTEDKRKTCVDYYFGINKRTKKKEEILAPLLGKPKEEKSRSKPQTKK